MMKVNVGGMNCGHCVSAVTKAVEAVPGVERAVVDLAAGQVSVEGSPKPELVHQAIEDAGFEVKAGA